MPKRQSLVEARGGVRAYVDKGTPDLAIPTGLGDLLQNMPEQELQHWADHVAQSDLSENFCKMSLHPGSCSEDGDPRDW